MGRPEEAGGAHEPRVRRALIGALAFHVALGAALVAGNRRLGRRALLLGALAPLAVVVWTVVNLGDVVDGHAVVERVAWVPGLDLALELRVDGLAATMALLVGGIGVGVLLYAHQYFGETTPDLGRLAGLLVLFAGAMTGLVAADHLLALYGFWELTSIASFLLIGNRHDDAVARAAALHALLVTGLGGLAMLGGLVVLGHEAGTYRVSELAGAPVPTGTAVGVALVLVLLGAFTKSAQYPFHSWLPGAMAAPTPVSAYLHSATMVKAGVVLVARLAPIFATAAVWRPLVLVVGAGTMVAGGLRALRQHDLKLLLAYGTVSQLGLLVVLFGAGTEATRVAAVVLLLAHATCKAGLFLVVGILDRQTGTRDLRRLPRLGSGWRLVAGAGVLCAASMAGAPTALGFIAKEAGFDALGEASFAGAPLVLASVVAGSVLTAAYSLRFVLGAFVATRRRGGEAPAPPVALVAPAVVAAAVGLVLGVAPSLLDPLVSATAGVDAHLAPWHGANVALLLSAVALGGGALLALGDRQVQGVLALGKRLPTAAAAYRWLLRHLGLVARRITGVVQNGSLPVYAGVVLLTAAVLPLGAIAGSWATSADLELVADPATVPIAAVLVAAGLGAAIARQRFTAAVFLGLSGYAMAGFFLLRGAPDLALTQAAIETLSTVLFVLVLRRLPDRFERQSSSRRRVLRLAVAATVGAAVFVLALAAAGNRGVADVSARMVERAVPDGHGRNVVNVILVDFRALDTLGEITVLAAACIGAVALARVGRRVAVQAGEAVAGPPAESRMARVVFVDVSAQLIFHAVLIASLWMLLAGHNQPGGGFVAGLLAGSAIALRYVAGGIGEVRALSRFAPWTVLGAGLVLAGATATFPLLTGNPVLDVAYHPFDLPLAGDVKFSSALLFDTGVFMVVVGMVLMVFEAFGEEPVEAAR